jgi:arginyl-tRNA synthetase
LEEKGLLEASEDGRKMVRLNNKRAVVTVQKSDGSSLYLSRDCAAALDRSNTFQFDRMLYVVDNSQADHFSNMFSILGLLEGKKDLVHVRFGRVQGMSSRKGSVIFLRDILDEAKDRVAEQRRRSPNTRADLDNDHINDILGISAVLVNDMKRSRLKDYEFNWDKAVQSTGDSGVKLQYSHCRLASLLSAGQRELGVSVEQLVDQLASRADLGEALGDEAALNVIYRVARFDEAVRDAYVHLEPCHLVQFLFQLCNEISRALVTLPVLKNGADPSVAAARLALFAAARATLAEGMKLLGLVPLDEM